MSALAPSCSRCCPALNRWLSDLSHMLQHVCCFCCATIVNGMAAAAWVYYIPMVMLVSCRSIVGLEINILLGVVGPL